MVSMEELLNLMVQRGGSDLHLSVGAPPKIRIDGKLVDTEYEVLMPEATKKLVYSVLGPDQVAKLEKNLEIDFSFGVQTLGRFRTNAFVQRGSVAAVLRVIPYEVYDFQTIGLPVKVCEWICNLPRGLVLCTGSTGSGKSTTLASMINYINESRQGHIITIEDPIEFLHRNKGCLINQREVGGDTHGFDKALKSVLRQDPDVVLVGEMRDLETIEAALTLAETGHLTFATLHTSDVTQTVNRIVDVFPAHQQQQIRTMLSFTLQAVICQQLVPRIHGKGRALAAEVMIVNPAIRALVRDNKAHQIMSIVQTGGAAGMRTMNQSLFELYRSGTISYEDALDHTGDEADFQRLMERQGSGQAVKKSLR
ncbi:MAG: type IV pilus twitching motility protein PilT [Planctomycetes bacterium]|nr:type IV pilus twitching motility protein PilT [Planctomycetota bacterium]MCC7397808.1 type IV pilus twitching motility protein PilT [Planctomycetota bacterium]